MRYIILAFIYLVPLFSLQANEKLSSNKPQASKYKYSRIHFGPGPGFAKKKDKKT